LFLDRPCLARTYCWGQKHEQGYRSNQEREH
jgi:hypothetical protein